MKTPLVQPYLIFNGRCAEALDFYTAALGAERGQTMRFSDCPDPLPEGMIPPDWTDKIMHAEFSIGDHVILASDGCQGGENFSGFFLSISLPDEAAVNQAFTALAEGGEITMPLGPTFYSPRFGMLKDRFGLGWSVGIFTDNTGHPN